jgi:anaphase-promoting complex subunit 5
MARFLTPAKIGLLALIELYTDAEVQTSSTIPILSFLISHILPPNPPSPLNPSEDQAYGSDNFILSTKQFEELLIDHPASGLPGRSLWYLFLKKLWDINSLDALHVFFDHRSHLLVKTREDLQRDAEMGIPPPSPGMILLSRTSPFGTFVRRAQLEFFRLKFHDALNLWKSFVAFRQQTLAAWKKKNPDADHWSFDVVLHEGSEEWGDNVLETFGSVAYGSLINQPEDADGLVSTDDVEKLLEFQVEQMQSKLKRRS